MKKVFWTTTEYLVKINKKLPGNYVYTEDGRLALFKTKNAALNDTYWMKQEFPKLSKLFKGPKIVKVTFEVIK